MRYLIPFQDAESVIEYFIYLIKENPDSDPIVVMSDDGEKFGMWSSTYKYAYENKWLERFLAAEVLKEKKSSGRIYLPCTSYSEMSQWALPADAQQIFENFIDRYSGDI